MRIPIIILLLLSIMGAKFSNAAHARFYITASATNDLEQTYMDHFQTQVNNLVKENFPCAYIQTRSNVAVMLDRERERQLVGVGGENAIENIGESMKCDYLISLNIRILNNTANIVAFCANPKRAQVLSRASSVAKEGDILNMVEKVSKQLIEGLQQYEICPFTGPVSITLNSELDSTKITEYGVYCNETDQQYHQKMEIHTSTFSDWKLQRKGISWTEGTMTFYMDEESKVAEENGCYKCKSGREGGRTYSETNSIKVKGSGISHESTRYGKPQDDTRVELRFLENGTYLVIAKGTSLPVIGEEKVTSKAEGSCDNIPQETKVVPREIRIPLKVIFGPYEGKSTDKVLQQKDTKESTDPATKEKSSVTIDFSLTQKDK